MFHPPYILRASLALGVVLISRQALFAADASAPIFRRVELGNHVLGKKVATSLEIHNDADRSVRIKEVKTSCGCTTATASVWEVAAGGSLRLDVTVDSLGREGPFKSQVLVLTSGVQPVWARIELVASFTAPDHNLIADSIGINLGRLRQGEQFVQVIGIMRNGKVKVGELRLVPSTPWISAQLLPERTKNNVVYVQMKGTAPRRSSKVSEEIRIEGVGGTDDFTRVPIVGEILPSVIVSPSELLLQPGSHRYVIKLDGGPTAGKLTDCKIDGKNVRLVERGQTADKQGRMELSVELTPLVGGFVQSRLLLTFDGLSEPVELPCVGWIPPDAGSNAATGGQ